MNSKISKLSAQADAHISAYMGGAGLGGQREEYIAASPYSGMAGGNVTNSSKRKTITIDIFNTDNANDLWVPLFSANQNYAIPFDTVRDKDGTLPTSGRGIIVTPKNYELNELKEEARSKPFFTDCIRYSFGDQNQLELDWIITKKDGNAITNEGYEPFQDLESSQNISTFLTTKNFATEINGGTTLWVKVAKAHSASVPRKVQLMIYVASQIELNAALRNRSVITVNAQGE